MAGKNLGMAGGLLFLFFVSNFALAQDCTPVLFVTKDSGWSGNEFYLYGLVAEGACSISKVPVADLPVVGISNFSYILVSFDAGESVDEPSCEKIRESNLPFIYFSPHFNTACSDTLKLTSGSGFTKSLDWNISDVSFHNSSSVRVFESAGPLLLPYISTQSDYGAPSIIAQKDASKAYLVLFGGSPRRAFLSFPNYENLTLTPDGKQIFSRTIGWLNAPEAAPPTGLAVLGFVKSPSFILAVFVLSLVVVALAFAELRQKSSKRRLRMRLAVFVLVLFAVPLAAQALTHTTSLSISRYSLPVSESARAVCRVDVSGGDSNKVELHLQADFGGGFVDIPTSGSNALKANRDAWTDCDVVYESTYCERSWVLTALSSADVPVRCVSNSDETAAASVSGNVRITAEAGLTLPPPLNASAQSAGSQTGGNVSSAVAQNVSLPPAVPKDNGTKPAAASSQLPAPLQQPSSSGKARLSGRLEDADGKPLKGAIDISRGGSSAILGDVFNSEVDAGKYDVDITLADFPVKRLKLNDFDVSRDLNRFADLKKIAKPNSNFVEAFAINPLSNCSTIDMTFSYSAATSPNLVKCRNWDFANSVCNGGWVTLASLPSGAQDFAYTFGCSDPAFGVVETFPIVNGNFSVDSSGWTSYDPDGALTTCTVGWENIGRTGGSAYGDVKGKNKACTSVLWNQSFSYTNTIPPEYANLAFCWQVTIWATGGSGNSLSVLFSNPSGGVSTLWASPTINGGTAWACPQVNISQANFTGTGNYNLTFKMDLYSGAVGNAEVKMDVDDVNLTIGYTNYGYLNATINLPQLGPANSVDQNKTFKINATVQCIGTNAICPNVSALARYNLTSALPDTKVNTTSGGKPFFTLQANPGSCGQLNSTAGQDTCNLEWTVNATGAINSIWLVDVNFSSSNGNVTANDTGNAIVQITAPDTQSPTISIQVPSQNQNFSSLAVPLNFTVGDFSGVSSCRYELSNSSGSFNFSLPNCQNVTMVGVTEGSDGVKVWANDSLNNWGVSSSVSFRVDVTPPYVAVQAPSPGQVFATANVPLNFTVGDVGGVSSCKYELANSSGSYNLSLPNCQNVSAMVGVTEGSDTVRVWANDSVNNWNVSGFVSFAVDTTAPGISIQNPQNTTYATTSINLNYTAWDLNGVSQCKYELNGVNATLATCQNATITAIERNNTLKVWANDTSNNWNVSAMVSFTVDTTPPAIAIQNPTSIIYATLNINLNYTTGDLSGVSQCKYELNGVNASLVTCQNTTIVAAEGINTIKVWANDSLNNWNVSSSVSFTVDTTPPTISIQSPTSKIYATTGIGLNYTAWDLNNVSQCKYELNGANTTLATCQNTTITAAEGANTIKVWANDTGNNWNASGSVSFTVDTGYPSLAINSPANQSWQRGTISVNYSAADSQAIDRCSWRWRNSTGVWAAYSAINCGTSLAFNFNTAGCGDNSTAICVVEVRANDTANNVNSSEVYLKVDNTAPSVDVSQPAGGWFNGSVLVRIVVNDSTSGASSVVFYNGSTWASAVLESGNSNNGVWNGTIRTNAFVDGTAIQINANATDLLGNNGSDASVPTVQVDNNPPKLLVPALNVSSPTNKNANIFVNSTFNDNGGQGLSANSCQMYVSGATSVSPYSINNSAGASGAVNGTISAVLNDGTNNVYLNCSDLQGWTGSNYTSLIVDTTPPAITIQSPSNATYNYYAAIALNFTAFDLNGVSFCKYEIKNSTGFFNISLSNCQNATLSGVTEGGNSVKVWANDSVGNWNSSVSVSFTLDTTVPGINIQAPFQGQNFSTLNVSLNFTVFDVGGVSSCRYELNGANTSIPGCQNVSSMGGVVEGPNGVKVWANDSVNNWNSSAAVSFTVDTRPPAWVEVPQSQTIAYGYAFYYDVNATDSGVGVDKYFINDSTNFKINSTSGVIENRTLLAIGSYLLNVSVNDTLNNVNSTVITVTVKDLGAPTWNQTPSSQNAEYGVAFYYRLNASDNVAVDKFWLNDSTNFRINVTSGVVENKTLLGLGVWLLNVSVNDTSGNGNSSLFNVTVRDTRAPSWDQAPANQVVEFGSAFYYDLNASDLLLDKYWINDSANFRINASTGVVQNNTPLAVGVYLLNASANDTSGNRNSSLFSVTVQDTTPPSISNQNSNVTTLNVNENFCINATVTDLSGVDAVKAEVWNTTAWANYTMANSSGVCNAGGSVYAVSIQATAEGTWNYSKVFANDTRANLQAYDFADLTVSVTSFMGTVSLNITQPANGSDYNLTYAFTATINASCSLGLCGATNITLQYCSGAGCSDWAAVSATSPVNASEPAKKLCSSNLLAGQTCSVSWNVSGISGGTYRLNGFSQSVKAPAANASAGVVYINALNLTLGQPVAGSMFNPGTNFTLSGTVGCLGRFCGQVSAYVQANESGPWLNAGGGNLTIGINPFDCGRLNYTAVACSFAWNVSGRPGGYSLRALANNSANTLGNVSVPTSIVVAGQSVVNLSYPRMESSVFVGDKLWVNSSVLAYNWTVFNCGATLYNQSGLEIVSGARIQDIGNISAGGSAAANWQLNGTQEGLYNLTVNATCGYGAGSSILVYPIEVTPLSANVSGSTYATAEKLVINGTEWLRQSSDSGLSWWRNGRDEYVSFNGSSPTNPSFVGRWYVVANVSGSLYTFDFSNVSWGVKKTGVSGNSTYIRYVGETGYPKIRINYTQSVNSTADVSSINLSFQNLEPFTVDNVWFKWALFNFSINGDSGDDVLVFTNSTGQQESYPMDSSTSFSFNMSRFGATSATFRDPSSNIYGKIVWERNMSTQSGKPAFAGFKFEAGGNFSLNLTFDFGSFAPNAVKGFDPGSGLEQPGLVQRFYLASIDGGESPPPAYADITAKETDGSLGTTDTVGPKTTSQIYMFRIKLLNESLAYSWVFLQMNITAKDVDPYPARVYAYNSDNVTVPANHLKYNVTIAPPGSVNIDITNLTHQQDGFGYVLIRLTPESGVANNKYLTIAEIRFNTTVNSPPYAYWGAPLNGTWFARSAAAVKINCTASDDLLVRNVTFQQSSNGVSYANVSTDTVYSDNDWNWTYNPSANSGPCNSTSIGTTGACYLGCFATDGNRVDSAVNYSTIRIDGDAPAVAVGVTGVSKTTGWISGSKTITCSASDAGSGVNPTGYSYEYTLADSGLTGWTLISGCSSSSCSWDASGLNDANSWVRCNSTDNVSNVGTDSANYAGIDNTLPGAQVQSPSNVTYATAAVALNYTFGDSLSGVSSCRYEITNSSGSFNVSIANCQNTTLSGVTNGANSVKIWLNDSVNLWNSSAPVSFAVDTASPSVMINSPANQSWQRGTVSINYTATDSQSIDACSWRWRNSTGAWSTYSAITCGASLAFSFNTANCGDNSTASCVVEVRANDTANNVNSSGVYLKVDNTAPSVNVTQPASGWFNGSVIVRITANDSTSGAASVIFYNGSAWASAVLESGSSNNGVWNGTISTNAFADGTSIQISANATDVAGNNGSASSVPAVQVDNNPPRIFAPTLNVSNPGNKNTNIFVNSTFNDNGGQGLAANSCRLYVTGATSVIPYAINNSGGASGAVNGTISATLNDGTNNVYLNCTDLQGWTGSNYTTLVVDTQGPVSTLDRPANGTNITASSYAVNASVTDATSVSWVMFEYYNGTGWYSACNDTDGSPYNCSWTVSSLADARNYQVRVRANDTAGNIGGYDTHINITIDRTPPSAVLDFPASSSILTSSPILLNASSSSDAIGVYSVSFYYTAAGGSSWTLIGTNTTGKTYGWNNSLPADGTYDFNVTVNDTVGWQNSSKNTGIILNLVNDPPVCNVLYPNASGITVNGTITVNASANDTDPGDYVMNVTFEHSPNNGSSWTVIGTNTTSNKTYYALAWDTRGGDDSSQYLIRCTARDTAGASGSDTSDNMFTVFNNLVNITQVQDNGPAVAGAKVQVRANVSSNYGSITGVWAHIRQGGGQYTAYAMADTGCNDAAGNNVFCYEYTTGASIAATYNYYINATDGTYRSVKGTAYITGTNVSPSAPANFSTTVVSRADPLEIRSNFGPYYAGDKVLLVFTSRDLSGLPLANQNLTVVIYYPNGTVLWANNATNGGSGYYFYNNTLASNTPVGNYLVNLTMVYDSKTYADFASFLVQSPAGLTPSQSQQLSNIETLTTQINQTTKGVKELAIESIVRVKAGDPYNATIYYYDATHALADSPANISVILYNPNGTAVVTSNASKISLGKYRFDYNTSNSTVSGGWRLEASTNDTATTMYFYVVGGPFDVIITGMPDTFVPGVTASVTLLNTGDPKDVTLYWWTEYLNGTKVVTASETFLAQSGYTYRNLSLDHVPTGEFYFKVLLRYSGEEEASALRQFYATTQPTLAVVKVVSPDLILARRNETISVNLSVQNTATWDQFRALNITDKVPYDFNPPASGAVQLWYLNSTSYVQLTSGYSITVANLDADPNIEVLASIPEMSLTNIGHNLAENEYIFLFYSMNSSQMSPNTTRQMNSTVLGLDLNLKNATANATANITAANAILVAHKRIFSNPDYPAKIYVNITLQSLGGAISGIAIADYLPEGTEISYVNVTYLNSTASRQLFNKSDYLMEPPFLSTLPDGARVDVYQYNFSIASPVNWNNNLYENDSIELVYNATIIGGGTWILPTIIGGYDPVYKQHITTEAYSFHRVPLFDIILELASKLVNAGDSVKGKLKLLNIGGPTAQVDVLINYAIKTMDGALVTERSKTVAVLKEKEEDVSLLVPSTAKSGTYTFEALMTYTGREAMSTDVFEVKGTEETSAINPYLVYGLAVFALLAVMVLRFRGVFRPKETGVPPADSGASKILGASGSSPNQDAPARRAETVQPVPAKSGASFSEKSGRPVTEAKAGAALPGQGARPVPESKPKRAKPKKSGRKK